MPISSSFWHGKIFHVPALPPQVAKLISSVVGFPSIQFDIFFGVLARKPNSLGEGSAVRADLRLGMEVRRTSYRRIVDEDRILSRGIIVSVTQVHVKTKDVLGTKDELLVRRLRANQRIIVDYLVLKGPFCGMQVTRARP